MVLWYDKMIKNKTFFFLTKSYFSVCFRSAPDSNWCDVHAVVWFMRSFVRSFVRLDQVIITWRERLGHEHERTTFTLCLLLVESKVMYIQTFNIHMVQTWLCTLHWEPNWVARCEFKFKSFFLQLFYYFTLLFC